MAKISVRVECPGLLRNRQNDRMMVIAGQWGGGQHWPVGASYADLDEAVVAKMEGETKRGESVLKITRGVKAPKLDEITK